MPEAREDALIGALISKLPPPGAVWSRAQRVNWLRMLVMAFNESYGLEGPIDVGETAPAPTRSPLRLVPVTDPVPLNGEGEPPRPAARYVIDAEGFAMHGSRPIAPEDIPAGETLWDERAAGERGDLSTVLWKGEGIRAPERIPRLNVRVA